MECFCFDLDPSYNPDEYANNGIYGIEIIEIGQEQPEHTELAGDVLEARRHHFELVPFHLAIRKPQIPRIESKSSLHLGCHSLLTSVQKWLPNFVRSICAAVQNFVASTIFGEVSARRLEYFWAAFLPFLPVCRQNFLAAQTFSGHMP